MPDTLFTVAQKIGLDENTLDFYGRDKAKLTSSFLAALESKPRAGKLILVTAINPTPAGEGKTTTSIGLADALTGLGQKAALCLREPSLGPCFGRKGGATGGGKARVIPSDDINLHFTGDFHAITSAHNLLAALIDNSRHQDAASPFANARLTWRRVMDMNDRPLRHITIGQQGDVNGPLYETGFDITAASEVMACLCLAKNPQDLRARLGRMVVGWKKDGTPLTADLSGGIGAMMALLRDAMRPNLVQTLEGTPAFIHGGPFANIAHGCSSLMATQAALRLSDYVITEAGFGADLGAEKFFNIKARTGELAPSCVVVVATIRALKYQGGQPLAELGSEFMPALEQGMGNLLRHVSNLEHYGVPVVIALNRFEGDTQAEIDTFLKLCHRNRVTVEVASHYVDGGKGAEALAKTVMAAAHRHGDAPPHLLYDTHLPLLDKIRLIAKKVYHADDIEVPEAARKQLALFDKAGYGHLPVCMAKTPASFSDDPKKLGAPRHFTPHVSEVFLSAGAGFVVVLLGSLTLMPGLPTHPAALKIDLTDTGEIVGL